MLSIRERTMMSFMNEVTDKLGWEEKVTHEDVPYINHYGNSYFILCF